MCLNDEKKYMYSPLLFETFLSAVDKAGFYVIKGEEMQAQSSFVRELYSVTCIREML